MKVARSVLTGGKLERVYLSGLEMKARLQKFNEQAKRGDIGELKEEVAKNRDNILIKVICLSGVL